MSGLLRLHGIALIARRNLRQHAVATLISALSIALGCGLVMATFCLAEQTRAAFTGGTFGFDAVAGARGSPLQLVLNTVFHLETSPGNLPYSYYLSLKNDRRVAAAVPYAVGDNYQGFRIVGTTPELFGLIGGRDALAPRKPGRVFDPARREAVVGATVARRTGLVEGTTFRPYHGLEFEKHAHQHPIDYLVVGVLEPTNSPSDRVIWIPIEGVWRMEGHALVDQATGEVYTPESGVAIPDQFKEVSAVMIRTAGVKGAMELRHDVNRRGKQATLAWPLAQSMVELFDRIGSAVRVLQLLAYLVVVVGLASVVAILYGAIHARRREFAILRALGARRLDVLAILVLEAGTTAALGAVLSFAVYGAILAGVRQLVLDRTGVVVDVLAYHSVVWVAPLGTIAVGALAGLLPAWAAYRTDVAENLAPTV